MLTEQTMNSIKEIAEAVFVYGTLSKIEAKSILIRNFGMKKAECLEDGTIFVIDQNNQDAYLRFPLLTTNPLTEFKKMSM